MSLWCWIPLVVFLRFLNGQSPGSEINNNTLLYVVDIAQDELINPILASLNPFIHLSRRPVPSQPPIFTGPLPSSTSIITLVSPNLTMLTVDQTAIVTSLTAIETNPNSILLTPLSPDFISVIPVISSSQYFPSSTMEPVLTSFHINTMEITSVPIEMSTNLTSPVLISPTRIVLLETFSSMFFTPTSTVQMQLDDGTTFPPTTPSFPVINDTRLVILPIRPVQTVIPVRVTSVTSRSTTTKTSSSTTTRTSTTTSPTTTTPFTTATMYPVQELLRIVVTQPRWDRTNPFTNTYRSRMEAGLLKAFQEGDRRYVLLKEQEIMFMDNSTNTTIPEDIVFTMRPVSNVTIVQINATSVNGSTGTQVDFILLYEDNEFGSEWNVLNAYEGLERVNLLSNDEISAVLGNLVLQRPIVVSAHTNVIANSSHTASPSVSSPDYYGIIVGLSTVAAVLLAVCLVWLLLCIWIRCIRKPPKTVPTAISHHFTATQTSLPSLRPDQNNLKDQGIQTMVMPRKKSHVPSQILEQLNPLNVTRTKETSFIQKSFSDKQPPVDRAAAPRASQVAPLAKTQPLREKPVSEDPLRKPPREPRDAVQSQPEDAVVKSGGGRVKLVSVIKTNHMDQNFTHNALDRRKSESPRSKLIRIRSGHTNGGYEPDQRSPQYKRTVGEIKRELRNWEHSHI